MRKNIQALGRMKSGQMNSTEKDYANYLELLKRTGEIVYYSFDSVNLRLADKTFYKPDFLVMKSDGQLEIHEVKGFWTDDAKVKIKVAADKFPFKFIAIMKQSKKNGGGWDVQEF